MDNIERKITYKIIYSLTVFSYPKERWDKRNPPMDMGGLNVYVRLSSRQDLTHLNLAAAHAVTAIQAGITGRGIALHALSRRIHGIQTTVIIIRLHCCRPAGLCRKGMSRRRGGSAGRRCTLSGCSPCAGLGHDPDIAQFWRFAVILKGSGYIVPVI